jgi:LysR family transcriptional regulator, cys regulon transcriptional activator
MKLQQLRFLVQVVASKFNVTAAAAALHTSQSGVSRQIRLLEEELGATIFLREERRLAGLTEAGKDIVAAAQDVLLRAGQLKTIASDFDVKTPHQLTLATTHLHARYTLPAVAANFTRLFPSTTLRLIQTYPAEIFDLLANDVADLGLTTEAADDGGGFDAIPAYSIDRCLIAPVKHPLLNIARPKLTDIARYPLVMYDNRLRSGSIVSEAFKKRDVSANIVLSALDVDVIKAYVGAGIGVAVVPAIAYDPKADRELRAIHLEHLFPSVMTNIVVRRGKYLPRPGRAFIDLLLQDNASLRTAREPAAKRRHAAK